MLIGHAGLAVHILNVNFGACSSLYTFGFTDGTAIYSGPRTSYIANDLTPATKYSFYLQACTEGDDSPFSHAVSIVTPESGQSLGNNR